MYPSSLSPSRANDFQTCPLLFRYRTIDRLPEPPSAAAVRGTLVHTALEHLFDLPAGRRSARTALELLQEAWTRLRADDPESAAALDGAGSEPHEVLAPIAPLIDAYFTMEDPNRLEPHARELPVSAALGEGFTIRGFVDRIDRTPSGDVRIVDYKTGRSPKGGYEAKALFQMRFYALAWWRMTGEVPRMLQLIYLGNREFLRYEPDVEELVATERKVLALRTAINQAARNDAFSPAPSRLCDWCAFRMQCPAQGGVAPPLPPVALWPSSQPLEGVGAGD